MKLLYLIYAYPAGGGAETLVRDLMHGMVEKGHEVSLCVINNDYSEEMLATLDPRIRVILFRRQPHSGSQIRLMLRFASMIRREQIDIIHCQELDCVLFSGFAKLFRPRVRIVNTVHDSIYYPAYPEWKVFLGNRLLDRTVAISRCVGKTLLDRGVPENKVTLIYNAINTDKFQPRARPRSDLSRSDSSCSDLSHADSDLIVRTPGRTADGTVPGDGTKTTIRIGNVARFFPAKKGQDVLVKAIELLRQKGYNVHCSFAGGIFRGQEEAFDKLQQYVRMHGLSSCCTFLGNIDNVPEFLQAQDVFTLPSYYEGLPLSMAEALSAGLPCVVSELDELKEIFDLARQDNVRIGSMCKAGDAVSLSQALSEVIDHREQYHAQDLHAFAEKHFSMKRLVDEHEKLYEAL